MDVTLNEVIFESDGNDERLVKLVVNPNWSGEYKSLMADFICSGYFVDNTLMMDRFLDKDLTIDLEKLELAIMLAIEYLEFSDKFEDAIYIFLGNMEKYFELRGIKLPQLDRVLEESGFILGFCTAAAEEFAISRKVLVQFGRNGDDAWSF